MVLIVISRKNILAELCQQLGLAPPIYTIENISPSEMRAIVEIEVPNMETGENHRTVGPYTRDINRSEEGAAELMIALMGQYMGIEVGDMNYEFLMMTQESLAHVNIACENLRNAGHNLNRRLDELEAQKDSLAAEVTHLGRMLQGIDEASPVVEPVDETPPVLHEPAT